MKSSPSPERVVEELIAAGRWMSSRGFVPATSGNLSARLSRDQIAVTASGGDKGELEPDDFVIVDLAAAPHARASAETPLHLLLYRRSPEVGAVLHGHSLASTLVSQRHAAEGQLLLAGYELQKAFRGVKTHETEVVVPIFANSQDLDALARQVSARLDAGATAPSFLLAGHGFYTWGESIAEARRHLEALDFLLQCELERARLR